MSEQYFDKEDFLWEAIDEILWEIWDPIEIKIFCKLFGGTSRDEYTSYTDDVFNLVTQGTNKETLAQHLIKIEKEMMGLEGNIYHCRMVAEKIISVYVNLNRLRN